MNNNNYRPNRPPQAGRPQDPRSPYGRPGPLPRNAQAGPGMHRPQGPVPRRPQAPMGQAGPQARQANARPQLRPEKMQTRPLEPYPGYSPEVSSLGGQVQKTRKGKSKALPILLSLLLVVALGFGAFALLNRGSSAYSVEAMEARARTNSYRLAGQAAQRSILNAHLSLASLAELTAQHDAIAFKVIPEEAIKFVDNDLDFDFVPRQAGDTMGRLVIPSIGVDAPLSLDGSQEVNLYWGAGIVPFMPQLGEDGMNVILGHRVLNKRTGLLYLDEMQEKDPFYMDDFRTGTRYHYNVRIVDNTTEEEYFERFNPDGPSGMEQSTMLVVCEPFIYNVSERRILVYGELTSTSQIPEDDPYLQRYQQENGLY